jgi:hypothetical protein
LLHFRKVTAMADEPTKFIIGDTAISATEEPLRKRFFRRKTRQRPPLTHCENCGTELAGHFCAQCGQPAMEYRRFFWHVLRDLLESFLYWDSKFFATIWLLITRPWRLTNEFLAGRRVRYLHPARLYLLASILFFFAVTYWAKSANFDPINLSSEQHAELNKEMEREDVPPEVRAKVNDLFAGGPLSRKKRSEMETELKREDLLAEERAKIEQTLKENTLPPEASAEMNEAMKDLSPEIQAKVERALKESAQKEKPKPLVEVDKDAPPNSFEKWVEDRAKEKFGEGTRIQLFVMSLLSNLPYMMLACIPLFAFVLKILYIRRRIFYIDHLVYALHIHTFAYLAITLIVLATMGLNRAIPGLLAGWLIALLWVTFAVQILLSIRRVYRQGWFFSIFKFLVGGVAYLIVLLVAFAATVFITVVTPMPS